MRDVGSNAASNQGRTLGMRIRKAEKEGNQIPPTPTLKPPPCTDGETNPEEADEPV